MEDFTRDESDNRGKPPFLTSKNWDRFRDGFLDWSMRYGDAGHELVSGVRHRLRRARPDYNEVIQVPDPQNQGQLVDQRVYAADANGFKLFEMDLKAWIKFQQDSGKLGPTHEYG